jgi:hypothetical protein
MRAAAVPRTRLGRIVAAVLAATALVAFAPPARAATPPPVLLADGFEDGDFAGWAASGGTWSVAPDQTQALRQGTWSAPARITTGDPDWDDYAVSADYKPTSTGAQPWSVGVMARLGPDGSHYRLINRSDRTLALEKVLPGGTVTLATTGMTAWVGIWQRLRLTVKGDTLIGTALGTPVTVVATDSALGSGAMGLTTEGTTAVFDNVRVESWATPAPGAPDTQAPQNPQQVAYEVGPEEATISWLPTVDDTAVTEYVVYQGSAYLDAVPVATLNGTGPVTLPLDPTTMMSRFAVAARDAAGNESRSNFVGIPQPPSFPRTPGDTVQPAAPGIPTVTAVQPDGDWTLAWEPATDDTGVVEYHVYLVRDDNVTTVAAKVPGPSASVRAEGGTVSAYIRAFDASWNSRTGPTAPLVPPPAPAGP